MAKQWTGKKTSGATKHLLYIDPGVFGYEEDLTRALKTQRCKVTKANGVDEALALLHDHSQRFDGIILPAAIGDNNVQGGVAWASGILDTNDKLPVVLDAIVLHSGLRVAQTSAARAARTQVAESHEKLVSNKIPVLSLTDNEAFDEGAKQIRSLIINSKAQGRL